MCAGIGGMHAAGELGSKYENKKRFTKVGNNHASIVALLFANGCSVHRRNAAGDTPLHVAVRQSAIECIQLLCFVS